MKTKMRLAFRMAAFSCLLTGAFLFNLWSPVESPNQEGEGRELTSCDDVGENSYDSKLIYEGAFTLDQLRNGAVIFHIVSLSMT